jgi:hypothetical protein
VKLRIEVKEWKTKAGDYVVLCLEKYSKLLS